MFFVDKASREGKTTFLKSTECCDSSTLLSVIAIIKMIFIPSPVHHNYEIKKIYKLQLRNCLLVRLKYEEQMSQV